MGQMGKAKIYGFINSAIFFIKDCYEIPVQIQDFTLNIYINIVINQLDRCDQQKSMFFTYMLLQFM